MALGEKSAGCHHFLKDRAVAIRSFSRPESRLSRERPAMALHRREGGATRLGGHATWRRSWLLLDCTRMGCAGRIVLEARCRPCRRLVSGSRTGAPVQVEVCVRCCSLFRLRVPPYLADIALAQLEARPSGTGVPKLLDLAADAERRHFIAWSSEARLATWEVLRVRGPKGAADALRATSDRCTTHRFLSDPESLGDSADKRRRPAVVEPGQARRVSNCRS